ncbi:MAG: hypothetical protein AB7O24_03560 [Kofleriaceae bacterium]
MQRIVLLIALVVIPEVSAAQPPGTTPATTTEPSAPKRLRTALFYSWGATAASGLVGALGAIQDGPAMYAIATVSTVGLLVGPSAGHWYLDRYVTRGLIVRVVGVAAGLGAGFALASDTEGEDARFPLMLGGLAAAGAYATGLVIDVATLPREVRRFNGRRDSIQIGIIPVVTPDHGSGRGTGLALIGSF